MATENKNKKMRNVRNLVFVMVALVFLVLCQAAFATDGMVAYWRFDEGDGSTAFDSVNGNDGNILGPTWTTGLVGTALSFDGLDDIVEIPESPYWDFASSDFSVEFWLNNPTYYWDWESIIGNEYHASGDEYDDRGTGWGIWIRQGDIGFQTGAGLGTQGHQMIRTWEQPLTYGSWHHVVMSREGTGAGNFKIYVDDILVKTGTLNIFTDNDYPLRIGRSYEHMHRPLYFGGLIDEVVIYNALTNPETMLGGTALFIMAEVDTGNIDPELEGSLLAKVEAALSALERGNPNDAKVAMNDLKALINQVEAQTDNKITTETATEIIQSANDIIAELGG